MLLAKAKSLELSRLTLYKNSASKIISPDGKAVLLFLARSEEMHFDLLKKEVTKLKKLNRLDIKNLLKMPIIPLFKRKELRFNHTSSSLVGDVNIIKTAINVEKKDAPFYAKLAKETPSRDGKKLFLTLKNAEVGHLILLKKKLMDLQVASASLSEIQAHKRLF